MLLIVPFFCDSNNKHINFRINSRKPPFKTPLCKEPFCKLWNIVNIYYAFSRANAEASCKICLIFVRGESHIDFRTQCVIMTLAGGRLLLTTFWKKEKLLNLKVHELSFTTKFISVSCYRTSAQVKYHSQ